LYIETQGAYAVPIEQGGMRIFSSTQGPTAVQRAVARVTALPMHQIEVDVTRLGGGFGGKEDQANAWAAMCAVGTQLTRRPVKYALHRMEDMRMTGKRHPYSADYKMGLDKNLKIVAYAATFYQNAGASADLSPPVLERHFVSLHERLLRSERDGDGLQLPHESAAEHGVSRLSADRRECSSSNRQSRTRRKIETFRRVRFNGRI
jgi:xanthine dehydrogenase molybdopterin-binding subunit B